MKNTMQKTFGIYQGQTVVVLAVSDYWNEALVRYPWSRDSFKIGLPLLEIQKMEEKADDGVFAGFEQPLAILKNLRITAD